MEFKTPRVFFIMDPKADNHFKKAADQLRQANEELHKPNEDVVSFLVCKNSVKSIENQLKGFLAQRGFDTHENESLDHLLERCRLLDKKFYQISFDAIDCSANHIHDKFCDEVEKVSGCFQTADQLDSFLRMQKII